MGSSGSASNPDVAIRHVLDHLARRWFELHAELKTHTKILKTLTIQTAPSLVEAFGVGFDTAAEMLLAAGENYDRIRSESAIAKLCGVCPIFSHLGWLSPHHSHQIPALPRNGLTVTGAGVGYSGNVECYYGAIVVAESQGATQLGSNKCTYY